MTAKILPRTITSYDLLKAFAILSMLVDHVGYYFFLDDEWFRVFGRFCVPIWFFLIGYANSRDLGPRLWIGGAVLVLANIVTGMSVFPLNILFSMLIIRIVLDRVMEVCKLNAEILMGMSVLLLFLVLPSYAYWEYGVQGLIMAMFGYIMRNRPVISGVRYPDTLPKAFGLFCLAQFILVQGILFGFNLSQLVVMSAGLWAVYSILYFFRPTEYPELTAKLPGFAGAGVRFLGRRTLEIYVAHLILFKFLDLWLDPDRFQLFHWSWMMK